MTTEGFPVRADVAFPAARAGSARRMAPERRREQLIRIALQLFAEQPPDLVTADDVARAADVSRALFYRYFGNMHDLREAALRAAVDELIAVITPPDEGTLLDQVRYSLHAFLGSAQAYSAAYIALMRTGSVIGTEETYALVERVRDHIVRMVAERMRLAAPGETVGGAAPMFELTMRSWFSVVELASVAWLREGKLARERLEEWLVDQLVAMLQTTARHDPGTAAQLSAALATT